MKKEIPVPALIAIVLIVLVLVVGIGWYAVNRDTGVIHAGADEVPGKKPGKQPLMPAGNGGGNAAPAQRAIMKPPGS